MPAETVDLYYSDYGSGPPLVVLHGLLGASGNWHTLSRTAFAEHFHVFAVDQRNHGRSPHTDRLDYDAMAADVVAFLDRHGLDRAHLLGHSMGGKTAMHAALAHPDRVRRLVVVDMAPRAYPPHHTALIDALRGLDPGAYDDRAAIDAALARDVASKPVRQFLMKNLAYDDGRYRWQMNVEAIHRHYGRINEAVEGERPFEGPTLFVRGGASEYLGADDLPAIRALFPQATLETIDGAGHWVHADQPDALAEAVAAFLTRETS